MKKKVKVQFATGSLESIQKELRSLNDAAHALIVDRYTKPSKNTRAGRNIRKSIAVLYTLAKQKNV